MKILQKHLSILISYFFFSLFFFISFFLLHTRFPIPHSYPLIFIFLKLLPLDLHSHTHVLFCFYFSPFISSTLCFSFSLSQTLTHTRTQISLSDSHTITHTSPAENKARESQPFKSTFTHFASSASPPRTCGQSPIWVKSAFSLSLLVSFCLKNKVI